MLAYFPSAPHMHVQLFANTVTRRETLYIKIEPCFVKQIVNEIYNQVF